MPITLSNTQERVERTLFEVLRLLLVDTGYSPDITGFPHDATGDSNYEAAKKAIRTTKKFCVELFGVGSQQSKYLKRVPRIVIVKRRFVPSLELGLPVNPFFQPNTNDLGELTGYTEKRLPNSIIEGHYDLILSSNTAISDRVMNAIAANGFPGIGYLAYHDNPDERFLIEFIGQYEQHDHEEGVHNYVLSYKIPDLCLASPIEIGTAPPIECITLNTLTFQELQLSTMTIGTCPEPEGPADFDGDDFDDTDFNTP